MAQEVPVPKQFQDEVPDYPNIQKIKKATVLFINLSLALLITLIFIRIGEFFYILLQHDIPADFLKVAAEASLSDLVFFLKLISILFIPYVIGYFITAKKKPNYLVFGVLATLIILTYVLLIKYFGVALVPLGADLFGYSLADIEQTASGSANFDILSVFLLLIPLIAFWLLLSYFSSKKLIKPIYAYLILGTGILLAYFGISALPSSAAFKSDFSYNLSLNKAAFFTENSVEYFSNNEQLPNIGPGNNSDFQESSLAGNKAFKYLNPDYPFLREDNTEDVLGDFFTIDPAKKPNIVFIQVEGLGRAFSGKNAYLKSFTPFLDELADKGLYWENFLSAQGRTFASLPSIIGSLPFAEKGFSDLGAQMPKHFSLFNILNQNGYSGKYYGGFEMNFDNQGLFMKNAGANLIVSSDDYGKGFQKASTWGYADKDLMLKSIQSETQHPQQPFVTYMETVSMHSPYTVPNQQQFIDMFQSRMKKLGFDNATQASYNQYKEIYSSIMYTDEALRYFFKEYEKLPSFNNTIFIITGDHRLPEIPMSTKIDRFHVPLIVYSPMLKRTASFKSISSHLDITPSLIAFLKKNYQVKAPSEVTWVGSGLDTAHALRNIHKYPLKQTTSSLHNYISGLHFIDQDQLFTISENMDLEPIQDDKSFKQLTNEFNSYKVRNNKFIQQHSLMPDSLYSKFIRKVN